MISRAQQMIVDLTGKTDFKESESSQEIYMDCPFCGKRNKFYISPRGQWICFHCETKGGSVTSFVMQYDECSYKEAQQILKEYNYKDTGGVAFKHDESVSLFDSLTKLSLKKEKLESIKSCPNKPTNLKYLSQNLQNPEANPYLWYLYKRHVSLDQIKQFKIGYVTEGKVKRHNQKPLIVKNCVVFPTFNSKGQMIYWNTRSIELHPYIKSINAFSEPGQYSRKDLFWNMDKIDHNSYMVICEGVFNALTCCTYPYTGIATFGKAITDSQVNLMIRVNPDRYYIFLDNDAKKQELELAKRLSRSGVPYDRIRIVNNPFGAKDANDLGSKMVKKLLDQAKPLSLISLLQLAKEGV